MNKIKRGLHFLLLLLSFQISAFQGSGTAEKEAVELLIEKEKEAERLYLEGRTVEAIQKFEAIQENYREIGLTENAIDLYEDLFAALIQNDNFELSAKIEKIEAYAKKESHPYFRGLYTGALAYAYLYHEEMDSMQKY